jgi:hypothetical protein
MLLYSKEMVYGVLLGLFLVVQPLFGGELNEVDCFTQVLRHSQRCDNSDVLHVGTMGGGSGLGSEFLAYYIKSLLTAASLDKRMVYVKGIYGPFGKWEYDCPQKAGWSCYFDMGAQCSDSIVGISAVKDNSTILLHKDLIQWEPDVKSHIQQRFNDLKAAGKSLTDTCNVQKMPFTVICGIASTYLYKLNEETRHAVKRLNREHGVESDAKYVSLQIRLTDKKYEMSKEQWEWMTHTENIAEFIRPFLTETKVLFVAADNCTTVGTLRDMLPSVSIYSRCLQNATGAVVNHNNDLGPRLRTFSSSLEVFADLEMLRKGEHFIGLFSSNLVRMVHLLRYPNLLTSHGLAASVLTEPKRRTQNDHMDDLDYY